MQTELEEGAAVWENAVIRNKSTPRVKPAISRASVKFDCKRSSVHKSQQELQAGIPGVISVG